MPWASVYHENGTEHEPKRKLLGHSPTERFFRSLKHEQLNHEKFRTKSEAKPSIIDYLAFYNGKRAHLKLGYQSPLEFERVFYRKAARESVRFLLTIKILNDSVILR